MERCLKCILTKPSCCVLRCGWTHHHWCPDKADLRSKARDCFCLWKEGKEGRSGGGGRSAQFPRSPDETAVLTVRRVGVTLVFSGHDLSSEGSAVWLSGDGDPRTDEEHHPVRRLGAQRLHEGRERGKDLAEGQCCPLLVIWHIYFFSVSKLKKIIKCAFFRAWEQTRKHWLRFCAHAAVMRWQKSRRSTRRVSVKCASMQRLTQSRVLSSLGSSHPSAALCPCVAFAKLELQTLIVLFFVCWNFICQCSRRLWNLT